MIASRAPDNNPGRTPIYLKQTAIGYVSGRTFHKVIVGSKHLLRRPPAIAFDRCTLADARRAGALAVAVTDRETGRTYRATLDTIETDGFAVRRGFGDQVALALRGFEVDGQPATPTRTAHPEPAQMSLFDVAVTP